MKKLILITWMIYTANISWSQTTLLAEGFENTVTAFTVSSTATRSFLAGNSVSPVLPTGVSYAAQGTYSMASTNGLTLLTTGAINTLSYGGIQLSLRVAAFATVGTNGPDGIDRVNIQTSVNGGGLYSDAVVVTGALSNDSWWSYTGTGTASAIYPTATYVNAPSSGFNANGPSTMIVTNLPSVADLRIKITINCGAQERWMIDDFKLTASIVLPVKLVSFIAGKQNNNVGLEWVIASPEDHCRYELQRSSDGTHFTTINTQTGDAMQTEFRYTDAALNDGKHYYRLAMTERSGSTSYSNIIQYTSTGNVKTFIYPSVIKDRTTLQTSDPKVIGTKALLVNSSGHIVQTFAIKNNIAIIELSNIPAGLYMLQLANGVVLKLMKE